MRGLRRIQKKILYSEQHLVNGKARTHIPRLDPFSNNCSASTGTVKGRQHSQITNMLVRVDGGAHMSKRTQLYMHRRKPTEGIQGD